MIAITYQGYELLIPNKRQIQVIQETYPEFSGIYWKQYEGLRKPWEGEFLISGENLADLLSSGAESGNLVLADSEFNAAMDRGSARGDITSTEATSYKNPTFGDVRIDSYQPLMYADDADNNVYLLRLIGPQAYLGTGTYVDAWNLRRMVTVGVGVGVETSTTKEEDIKDIIGDICTGLSLTYRISNSTEDIGPVACWPGAELKMLEALAKANIQNVFLEDDGFTLTFSGPLSGTTLPPAYYARRFLEDWNTLGRLLSGWPSVSWLTDGVTAGGYHAPSSLNVFKQTDREAGADIHDISPFDATWTVTNVSPSYTAGRTTARGAWDVYTASHATPAEIASRVRNFFDLMALQTDFVLTGWGRIPPSAGTGTALSKTNQVWREKCWGFDGDRPVMVLKPCKYPWCEHVAEIPRQELGSLGYNVIPIPGCAEKGLQPVLALEKYLGDVSTTDSPSLGNNTFSYTCSITGETVYNLAEYTNSSHDGGWYLDPSGNGTGFRAGNISYPEPNPPGTMLMPVVGHVVIHTSLYWNASTSSWEILRWFNRQNTTKMILDWDADEFPAVLTAVDANGYTWASLGSSFDRSSTTAGTPSDALVIVDRTNTPPRIIPVIPPTSGGPYYLRGSAGSGIYWSAT